MGEIWIGAGVDPGRADEILRPLKLLLHSFFEFGCESTVGFHGLNQLRGLVVYW